MDDNPKPEGRQYLIFQQSQIGQREAIISCILEFQEHHATSERMEMLMHRGWVDHVEKLEERFHGLRCILLPAMKPQNAIVLRSVG
jgi:hypothetical protein